MRILLDTHILLWGLADDARLPRQARALIEESSNDIFYSTVSPWEVEIKHLAHPDSFDLDAHRLISFCKMAGFLQLPIRNEHVLYLPSLRRMEGEKPHNDPFDRIMVCQAAVENMLFVTHDRLVAGYSEPCVFAV